MLPRRKNLLEAFKRSDAASAPPPAAPLKAPAPKAAPSGPLFERARARSGAGRPVWALVAVGLVLAFVLGFVVGRGSKGETRAEEKPLALEPGAARRPAPATQPRAFQERPSSQVAPEPAAAESDRLEDSALCNPRNAYTVVVAAYSNTNQDLAFATYEHLLDLGLPVFQPVASKNLILVVAGAAPTSSELAQIETRVKALTRDGKKAYETAYRARIDALFPRTPKKGQEKP